MHVFGFISPVFSTRLAHTYTHCRRFLKDEQIMTVALYGQSELQIQFLPASPMKTCRLCQLINVYTSIKLHNGPIYHSVYVIINVK